MTPMASRRQADKYWFSVEGETEKWYLEWLRDVVNADPRATRKVAFDVKVEKNPLKRAKSLNVVGKAEVWHVFDLEDEDELHVRQTLDTLKRMRDAGKLGRGVKYMNAYSNFTFELWILLHKLDMRAPLNHRTGYLRLVNREFGESYQDLDEYKHEGNFKRALGQLTIDDVVAAVARAKRIAEANKADGHRFAEHCTYRYCLDNPATDLWIAVEKVLKGAGIIGK